MASSHVAMLTAAGRRRSIGAGLAVGLARETLAGRPGNLPAVTGARGPRILGAIHAA